MSQNYERAETNPSRQTTQISYSDIARADDNCPMSGANSSRTPSPQPCLGGQTIAASSYCGKEITDRAVTSVSNLVESTRQQRDRDFFEKFLRSPTTDGQQSQSGINDFSTHKPRSSMNQIPDTQASIINHLLPQTNQLALLSSNYNLSAPMYSTFGMNLNYLREADSSLGSANTENQNSPFFNNVHSSTDCGGGFNDVRGNSLFKNNQVNTSDSIYIFSGNSNFSNNQTGNTFHDRQGQAAGSNKTYSSILHSTSQHRGLPALQQQQYPHTSDRSTSSEIQRNPTSGNCELLLGQRAHQSILDTGNINKQHQLMNAPNRLLNEYFSSEPSHRNLTFLASTLNQSQSIKPTSLSSLYQSSAASTANASTNLNRQSANSHTRNVANETSTGPNIFTSGGGNTSRRRNKSPFFSGGNYLGEGQPGYKLDAHGTGVINSDDSERFSRKVFVGGLPPDIDEEEIKASFRRFGALVVDWPHKAESKSYFPPKGYAFLLFQEESSVQWLIDSCFQEEDKLYLCVSSPTIKDKPVQVRPWRLSDSDFVLDSTLTLDPRKTVFVGGVPRPLKASELATIMNNLYGGVCYAGIDTDPELKYPKGAGRVAFSNHQSYIAAISARFVHIHHSEIEKRVEVKPYVLDDQFCDECQGLKCNNKFAPFFCANITCLRYYCDNCWSAVHSQQGKEFHKPLVKEGGDRTRGTQSFKW
jgi:cytoplasmic polyadenylation element-binding protein